MKSKKQVTKEEFINKKKGTQKEKADTTKNSGKKDEVSSSTQVDMSKDTYSEEEVKAIEEQTEKLKVDFVLLSSYFSNPPKVPTDEDLAKRLVALLDEPSSNVNTGLLTRHMIREYMEYKFDLLVDILVEKKVLSKKDVKKLEDISVKTKVESDTKNG